MEPRERLHEFWRQQDPPGNEPRNYVQMVVRSRALLELVRDVPKDAAILEVGCNVGRNLAYLYDAGYPNLQGVEINAHAIEMLRETYPQLADVPVHLGAGEDVLPTLPDDSVDLVYTMAVLEHIHPDSTEVFDNIVRVGRSLLAIEPTGRATHRSFPHDIPALFAQRGMVLRSTRPMSEFPYIDKALKHFTAYRFDRST